MCYCHEKRKREREEKKSRYAVAAGAGRASFERDIGSKAAAERDTTQHTHALLLLLSLSPSCEGPFCLRARYCVRGAIQYLPVSKMKRGRLAFFVRSQVTSGKRGRSLATTTNSSPQCNNKLESIPEPGGCRTVCASFFLVCECVSGHIPKFVSSAAAATARAFNQNYFFCRGRADDNGWSSRL